MYETSKCFKKRIANKDFEKYLKGTILDIGAYPDPIRSPYGITIEWNEHVNGDAQYLDTIYNESVDSVYSSHCLEHVTDIEVTLSNWVRVLRPGGYLYIVVPDYELYEKERWPSTFNTDHRYSFSINKVREDVDNRSNHYNVCIDLFRILKELNIEIKEIRLEDDGFDYTRFEEDQTMGTAVSHIVVIGKKK